MRSEPPEETLRAFFAGDRAACARILTLAEEGEPSFAAIYDRLFPRTGRAFRTGVTGPPGTGKSTLVDRLIARHRTRGRRVGVIAVDPTSPWSGGALLGDRIRMRTASTDEGVFVRSMATRGALGGLSRAAIEAADVLDAFGCEEVLVETVGVGQAEVDVVSATDTVVVVLQPGAGDGIQALKAGLLEIADVLVVNKADQSGASGLVADLHAGIELAARRGTWVPPVVQTVATEGRGVEEVVAAIEGHRASLREGGALAAARKRKRAEQVRRLVEEKLRRILFEEKGWARTLSRALDGGDRGPYEVAREILERLRERLPRACDGRE